MGKNQDGYIYTDMDWIMCQEPKDDTLFDGVGNDQPTENDTPKIYEKN